jgi:hypothetical protein
MHRVALRRFTVYLLSLCLLAGTSLQPVLAAMVSTEQALATEQRAQQISRVQELLQREAVQQQLQELGVAPEDAAARVAQLTDAELAYLDGQIDQLPAGGSLVAVIGVVFIVLLILDLVGVTNVFTSL